MGIALVCVEKLRRNIKAGFENQGFFIEKTAGLVCFANQYRADSKGSQCYCLFGAAGNDYRHGRCGNRGIKKGNKE
jgi:hypothetical protein